MVLVYMLIVIVLFIFIGFICFSTAAFCARRLDSRHPNMVQNFNPRIRRLLETIRLRNEEVRMFLNIDLMSYERMVEKNLIKEIKIRKCGDLVEQQFNFNQKECNVCFTPWEDNSEVAEI